MDELVFPASSSGYPSPVSSTAGHHQELEPFVSCDVLEGWPGGEDWLDDEHPNGPRCGDEGSGSRSPGNTDLSGLPPAPALKRRRGRKEGTPTRDPALCHVEAERHRRDKLNRRFCELRAAVPTVSRMDKVSVLSDATTYIAELRQRVKVLEAEAQKAAMTSTSAAAAGAATVAPLAHSSSSLGEELVVQMVGEAAAALRLTTAARHAPARLMDALRCLSLPVQHAGVCVVGGMTVQEAVVVDVPAVLRDERALREALLHRLQLSG